MMKKIDHDTQVSYLPPSWGGPFVWLRNRSGNLELTSIPKMTDAARKALSEMGLRR